MALAQPSWFGASAAVKTMLGLCGRMAAAQAPILVVGEAGTGKTVVAYHFHCLSGRKGLFVKDSAGWIPDGMQQGYMRGHNRGAFTGADRDSPGRIELANNGTYFLDEIGLAGPGLQQLLLAFLDGGSMERLGDQRPRQIDARFIAATNEGLEEAVREKRFRSDLFDRFWPFVLRVPPLRDRRDEILPLADTFVRRFAALRGTPAPSLSSKLKEFMLASPWRGNIRQLEKVCEYAVIMSDGPSIELFDLSDEILAELADPAGGLSCGSLTPERIRAALERADGSVRAAADLLGVHKGSVYRVLKDERDRRSRGADDGGQAQA